MLNEESTTGNVNEKKHNIPIEHFDFKYVETCNNIKELEKIYKVLVYACFYRMLTQNMF